MVYNVFGFLNQHFKHYRRKIEVRIFNASLYKSKDRELLKMVLAKDYSSARKLVLSSNSIVSSEKVLLEIVTKEA